MRRKAIDDKIYNKRRIFIKDNEENCWQLFSLAQNKQSGDIYFGSLEFTDIEWLTFKFSNNKIVPLKIPQKSGGHLSMHKSGQTRVTSGKADEKLVVDGNLLFNSDKRTAGIRHLFTIFPREIKTKSISEAGSRQSDYVIDSHKPLAPFVLVAMAIPNSVNEITFQPSFNMSDLNDVPGDILGFINIPLVYHNVFIFVYRTKNMEHWPKKHMIQYFDGMIIPLFFGEKGRKISSLFIMPEYKTKLTIIINADRGNLKYDNAP